VLADFVLGAKKDEKTYVGARVIFFVIGGMTYSEVRSAYELTKSNNREVSLYVFLASLIYWPFPSVPLNTPAFSFLSITVIDFGLRCFPRCFRSS
jgi:hypothetical protein